MKFVGVREAQVHLSGLVEQSQKERVILTRHGQPVAILTGVAGQDLEESLLAQDPASAGRLLDVERTVVPSSHTRRFVRRQRMKSGGRGNGSP